MELKIINKENKESGKMKLPKQFQEEVRADLVHRAVVTILRNKRQPYGAKPEAGMRHSTKLSRRRHDYKGAYGIGISRVPRKIISHRGTRFNWIAAQAPGTVGGRRAHPPKATKVFTAKINVKERRKAIRSALAATLDKEMVAAHGYRIPAQYPFIVQSDLEAVNKTKDVEAILQVLGFTQDLEKASVKKVRAGKGKMRNRKYKRKTSVLLVVSDKCALQNSAKNIPGVEITTVKNLNAAILAPGAQVGRATLFTEKAIERMEKENLFMN